MDPISAIRLSMNPALQGAATLDPTAGARTLRPFGPGELGPLSPDTIVAPGNQVQAQPSFENVLGQLVEEINSKQLAAGDAVHGLLSGENIPLHRVMIATEEASVAFQLMVEVRNKLLEAYQELMRMQV